MIAGLPADRYQSEQKARYRRQFWQAAIKMAGRAPGTFSAAVLETSTGGEVRELLALGVAPENIHAINDNAALLAHLTRSLERDGLGRVNTHGRKMLDALERIGRVDVVNYDGIGPVRSPGSEWCETVRRLARYGELVGVNVLGAREQGKAARTVAEATQRGEAMLVAKGREISAAHISRLRMVANAITLDPARDSERCAGHITDLRYDWYRNASGQSFLWLLARVGSHFPFSMATFSNRCREQYGSDWSMCSYLSAPACVLFEAEARLAASRR
jgi:hypothetical protein